MTTLARSRWPWGRHPFEDDPTLPFRNQRLRNAVFFTTHVADWIENVWSLRDSVQGAGMLDEAQTLDQLLGRLVRLEDALGPKWEFLWTLYCWPVKWQRHIQTIRRRWARRLRRFRWLVTRVRLARARVRVGGEPALMSEAPDLCRLLDHLENVCRDGENQWKARCPVCGSWLAVGWRDTPLIHCFGSCRPTTDELGNPVKVGDLVLATLGLGWGQIWGNAGSATATYDAPCAHQGRVARPAHALPSNATIEGAASRLRSDPARLRWLRTQRGLNRATLEALNIGWDGAAFTVPAFLGSTLLQYYRCVPGGKVTATRGVPRPLYVPAGGLRSGRLVVVCEGEWDAMVAWQADLNAVGRPGAGGRWRDEWTRCLSGRDIALTYDCDAAGRRAAQADEEALIAGGSRSVRRVDLLLGEGEGEDVTDWFVTYQRTRDRLVRLILSTTQRRPRDR